MQITVLGANGFLGRHLIRELANLPSCRVVAFDHFSTLKNDPTTNHPFTKKTNIQIFSGDFLNVDDLRQAVQGSDYVFHLISSTNPAASMNEPLVDIDTNIRGSVQLFTICSELNVKKVIFFSSGGTVYGDVDSNNISEDARLSPLSPYAIAKVTIEYYLEYFKRSRNLDYLIYRIANPYGPGQNIHGKQGVIPIFMRHILKDEPITVYGDGEMVRDYIYVDDLISMIMASFNKNTVHQVYNLGSGKGTSVNDIIAAIEGATGKSINQYHIDAPSVYVKRSVLNNNRVISEFTIRPNISLTEGIEKTWNYVKNLS